MSTPTFNAAWKPSRSEWILLALFLLTLPLINPWVRGDGVGYYAFDRALFVEHRLDFRKDWQDANDSFRMGRVDDRGNIFPDQFTSTGHLDNHFSIGPGILWAPFLLTAHAAVLFSRLFGSRVPADWFSFPYLLAMALGTALYGFLGLWLSYRLARKYVADEWALLATVAIWFASSLPVYMYFNPSWSHAHSAFAVALYLWYWDRTRPNRSAIQWFLLGLLAGLMMNVYYMNAVLMIIPLLESIGGYLESLRAGRTAEAVRLFSRNLLFALTVFVAFFPTLLTKKIIYGGYLNFGYNDLWQWNSPAFWKVAFSSEHGLFSWTPVLFLAIVGLFPLRRYDRELSVYLLSGFLIYYYAIGCYNDWAGISSFGNRFFISLTPIFIVGLAAFFDSLARLWREKAAAIAVRCLTAVLIVWNLGLIYQWGTHLIPARGPISWREAAYNQVAVVPEQAARTVLRYMTGRKQLMNRIEQQDVGHLKSGNPGGSQ